MDAWLSEWQRFPGEVTLMILAGLGALAVLATVLAARLLRLRRGVRYGMAGARLQTRLIVLFSVLALIPALVVSIFSLGFFRYGIQSWFDDKVRTALHESVAVAESYLREHQELIRADILAMAGDISREYPLAMHNPTLFNRILESQVALRALTEAAVYHQRRIVGRTALSFSLVFEQISPDVFDRADNGEVVVFPADNNSKVMALVRLNGYSSAYLLVSRIVDARVLQYMENASGAAQAYEAVRRNINVSQLLFIVVFVGMVVLLLLGAAWVGLRLARHLVRPLAVMAGTADRMRGGDLAARIDASAFPAEMETLAASFNRMAERLEAQHGYLVDVNQAIEERRHFIENVLSGVSAGVLALNAAKRVTLCNGSAMRLLGHGQSVLSETLQEAFPEVAPLVEMAAQSPETPLQGDVLLVRDGERRRLHVRIACELQEGQLDGFIITFDDVTPLVTAERQAAWANVARRIAHEIKNPLTPIQLAAERLKRKFLPQITEGEETFQRYTDTIIRHVNDIGEMVEEFAAFARMPAPVLARCNLVDLLQKVVFSEETAHPSIRYHIQASHAEVKVRVDAGQIRRMLANLMKNAAEALEGAGVTMAQIAVSLKAEGRQCVLAIRDNGPGFPLEIMDKLTEPYVTTRAKGTGLGLSIAKKIADDHRITLHFSNPDGGGAQVRVVFPLEVAVQHAQTAMAGA